MMRKNLFILAAAALALASCSSDETTAVNDSVANANEINFRALANGITRTNAPGVKSAFASGDKMNVYANWYNGTSNVKYFQADFTSDASTFSPSTTGATYYWPAVAADKAMTFTAVWGATQTSGTAGEIANYSPDADVAKQMDVLVARHVSTTKENPVAMNFRHTLSQVIVKAKSENANVKVVISGVQIGYVDKTGTFQLDRTSAYGSTDVREKKEDGDVGNETTYFVAIPKGKWSNTAATAASSCYTQTLASSVAFEGTATAQAIGSPWILLPQLQSKATEYASPTANATVSSSTASDMNGSYIAFKMAIYNWNGSTATGDLVSERWCCWPVDITWEPGYKYTYTIDAAQGGYEPADVDGTTGLDPVLGTSIEFSVSCTVDAWIVANSDVGM